MKVLQWPILLSILLIQGLFPLFSQYEVRSVYPSWFIYPEKYRDVSVGFGSLHVNAKYHAAVRHDILSKCSVSGYIEEYSENAIEFKIHRNYYYFYNEKMVDSIYNNLQRMDAMYTNVLNEESIEAFISADSEELPIWEVYLDQLQKPLWVDKNVWIYGGYINSVGRFHIESDSENSSWMNSEENAIVNALLFHSQFLISSSIYQKNDNSDNLQNYLATLIDLQINNMEIRQRYPDLVSGVYYTWIRIREGNIFPPSLDDELDADK